MKKIGIIGGLGPESTLMYYRELCARCHELSESGSYPEIVIASVDIQKMLSFVSSGDYEGLTGYLAEAADVLADAGCDFGAIASNTPHMIFPALSKRSRMPFISIVEASARKAKELGLRAPLLAGTGFTMGSRFYPEAFEQTGISLMLPDAADQNEIHGIIFPDLENGIVEPKKRERFLSICRSYIEKQGADGVILGCTELPLIAGPADFPVPVLDTARIHIDAIIARAFER